MPAFVLRRTLFALLLVFAAASASFALAGLPPGDHFTEFAPGGEARARAARQAAGFDRPLAARYASWVSGAVRLDLGTSLKFGRPVGELVTPRALNTAALGLCALVLATAIGVPLGVFTAMADTGRLRGAVRAASGALLSLPAFLVALGLTALAARAGWLPPPGFGAANMLVPALALALPAAAMLERTHSQAIRHALGEPYVRAARARGIPQRVIVWKHAMRGALGTTIGLYGVLAGTLLSGSFVVEIVADWPGLAMLMADAVRARDPFLVGGCAAAAAAALAGAVVLGDLLHVLVEPRSRPT